jgi:hydrogenase expression/formation protein HypD
MTAHLRYISEFRDGAGVPALRRAIDALAAGLPPVRLMEVCGTHTMAIHRHGISNLLPANVTLLSGPGCPVCVTPADWIDKAIALARMPGCIITSFGDMLRVPGSDSSLEQARAQGADVRVVYSTLDALDVAEQNPDRTVVFLGVGFETTAPTIAASIQDAHARGLRNYCVLCGHKTIPSALLALAGEADVQVNGFICPAHVSVVIGSSAYEFLARDFHLPCVVTGFEPLDILEGIRRLLAQIRAGEARVENQYDRLVRPEGNPRMQSVLHDVFEPVDSEWRGLGPIPMSGLAIRKRYAAYDAAVRLPVTVTPGRDPAGCLCGAVLRGVSRPVDCPLFGERCTPENPVGACMVSSEGTCAAWYKYKRI